MNNIPYIVLEAFPSLQDKVPIRRLSSPVPLVPDTTFDIFSDNQGSFALVTTDHVAPYEQSRELKSISGSYEFEFDSLQKPFGKNSETVNILDIDSIDGNYFVAAPLKDYKLYYYIANLRSGTSK